VFWLKCINFQADHKYKKEKFRAAWVEVIHFFSCDVGKDSCRYKKVILVFS